MGVVGCVFKTFISDNSRFVYKKIVVIRRWFNLQQLGRKKKEKKKYEGRFCRPAGTYIYFVVVAAVIVFLLMLARLFCRGLFIYAHSNACVEGRRETPLRMLNGERGGGESRKRKLERDDTWRRRESARRNEGIKVGEKKRRKEARY